MENEKMEIKIGERTIPLFYSTYEMIAIQEEIGCTAFQLREEVLGFRQDDPDDPKSIRLDVAKDPEKTKKLGKLLKILGNAGLEEAGQEPDLTEKWILRNMKPPMITVYAIAAMTVVVEGNQTEIPKAEEKGPVDEVLEEENAKKQPGN